MDPQTIMMIAQAMGMMQGMGQQGQNQGVEGSPYGMFPQQAQPYGGGQPGMMGGGQPGMVGYEMANRSMMDLRQKKKKGGFDIGSIMKLIGMLGKQQQQADVSQANQYLMQNYPESWGRR